MRVNMLLLSIILVFASCSTKDVIDSSTDFTRNTNDSTRVYSDISGTLLTITNSVWYTSTTDLNSFGQVNLIITGSTNADKVLVMSYGDGVIMENNILLDSTKSFKNDTIGNSFTHFSGTIPTMFFEASTIIKACKGSDTLMITLKSGKLKY